MDVVLNVRKINKRFGKNKVLNDVSFKIKQGQIMGFIGPNGAGKTTAIKLILGLQSIDSGEVYINNFNVKSNFEKAIEKVGAIVENPDLYLYLTGRQNLEVIARYYGKVDEMLIDDLLETVGLKERADDKVSNYSLGMRQRLGIAASLINSPNLLILDEPTNGLDPSGIKDLRDLIINLAKKKKIAVLISSHNLLELDSFCTHICLINKGEIVKIVNMKELKAGDKSVYNIKLKDTKGIEKYLHEEDRVIDNGIIVNRNEEEIPLFIQKLVENKYKIYEVKRELLSLEEAYLKIMRDKI